MIDNSTLSDSALPAPTEEDELCQLAFDEVITYHREWVIIPGWIPKGLHGVVKTIIGVVKKYYQSRADEGNFAIELSSFMYVRRGIKNGQALRFTCTWSLQHPRYGLIGESVEGWLATRDVAGLVHVSPPISRFGPQQSKQLHTITVDYYQLVKSMLENHRTNNGHSYLHYIGTEELRARTPEEIDPELPLSLQG